MSGPTDPLVRTRWHVCPSGWRKRGEHRIRGTSIMDQDPALATSEDEERAKVRKAQEVVERTSASVVQVCLVILTLLGLFYTLYSAAGIILPFVLALVLAAVLGPAMRVMNRRLRIPKMIAA